MNLPEGARAICPRRWNSIVAGPRAIVSKCVMISASACEDRSRSATNRTAKRPTADCTTFSSLVRRRQDSINGSALHLSGDLGVDTFQMPTLHLDFWFDQQNAIELQFRYLALYGSEPLGTPVTFNGDTILPGQSINTSGTTWFTAGLFYQRRISPWLYRQASATLPVWLQKWELRPKIGLEFVYLDFQINNGHPNRVSAMQSIGASSGIPLDARGGTRSVKPLNRLNVGPGPTV